MGWLGQLYVWKLTSTIDAIILRKEDPPLYRLLSCKALDLVCIFPSSTLDMLAIGIPVASLQCSSAYLAGLFSLRMKTKLVKRWYIIYRKLIVAVFYRLVREIIFSAHNLDEPVSMIDKDTLALILSHINKVLTSSSVVSFEIFA